MKVSRRLLVTLALLIADSAWLYVALALVGFIAELDSDPISWAWVLFVLVVGTIVGSLGAGLMRLVAKVLAGAVTIYIAAATLPARGGLELLWVLHLLDGAYPAVTVAGLVIAVLGAAFLWRQGGHIAAEPFLEERSMRHFRAGVMVLALALFFEVAGDAGLGVATMLFPFFAASLAGMALARMPHGGRADLNWTLIISITVVVSLGLGLAVGAVLGPVGRAGANALYMGLSYLVGPIREALWVVLAPILEVLFAAVDFLFSLIGGPTLPGGAGLPSLIAPMPSDELTYWKWLFELWPFALGFLFVALAYLTLKPVARRIRGAPQSLDGELHETIDSEARSFADLTRLLSRLFAASRADKGGIKSWRYPPGETGITEAFQLYFRLLQTAIERGHKLRPNATPLERIPGLSSAIPGAPVEQITRLFNSACYGRSPTKMETIDGLRDLLEQAVNIGETTSRPT